MMIRTWLALAALAFAYAASAQQPTGQIQGQAGDFTAIAVATTDADWLEKWQTPRQTTPNFNVTSELSAGQTATILTFFSNPQVRDGTVRIACDIRIIKPDGEVANTTPATPCVPGRFTGPPWDVYLTGMAITIKNESKDDPGMWRFQIGVSDQFRDVRIPLELAIEWRGGG